MPEVTATVGQSVCCLPMLIALFGAFFCLAPFIAIIYISSLFPIDPDSSGWQCSLISYEHLGVKQSDHAVTTKNIEVGEKLQKTGKC